MNLLTGSQIFGTINMNGGTVNIASANTSSVLNISLASINLPGNNGVQTGNIGLQAGGVLTVIDPTGLSVRGVALSSLTSSFHHVISQRMAQTDTLPPVQVASLGPSPGMLFQEREPAVWGEVFGSRRQRDDDGLVLAHTHEYHGFTGGYEQDYRNVRLGVMAGFSDANIETDILSVDTDTETFFAGVYGLWHLGKLNLTASLAAGIEDHDNKRTVVDNMFGIETARADFINVFFSPSVTLSSAYTFADHYEFRPSATLSYTVARFDDYTETGTTRANLTIDDRTTKIMDGRIQLAVAMALNKASELEIRTGITTRHVDDDKINASLAGSSFKFSAAGDDSVEGVFIGGKLRYKVAERLNLLADVEYREARGSEYDISARLALAYRF